MSDGSGWSWHGTDRWEEDGFPLNTGEVEDRRNGTGRDIYSLHRSGDGSIVWDADGHDERHRVLCRRTLPAVEPTTEVGCPAVADPSRITCPVMSALVKNNDLVPDCASSPYRTKAVPRWMHAAPVIAHSASPAVLTACQPVYIQVRAL